jgi:serine/threonine protein kinase
LKIADFGLAKKLKKLSTTRVVTMWYRAPELLLGVKSYSVKVDIWSVGCIAAEMLLRSPLFEMTNSETEIINKIYEFTGTPDTYGWEEELMAEGKNYPECKPSFSGGSTIISYLREKCPQF